MDKHLKSGWEIRRFGDSDFKFDQGIVIIREKKKKKGTETTRHVPLTPLLAKIMKDYLCLHSRELTWGYGGSGPAQLALALAADVLGDDDKAQKIYQKLKFSLIGGLPDDDWVLTESRIRSVIDAIEQERGRTR